MVYRVSGFGRDQCDGRNGVDFESFATPSGASTYLGLEQRVLERTAELEVTNAKLIEKMAARRRIEDDLRSFHSVLDQTWAACSCLVPIR